MYLSDAIDEYLQHRYAKKEEGTARCDKGELKMFLARTGNIQLKHLTVKHVNRYFYGDEAGQGGRNTEVAPASFNNSRARLLGFMKWAQHRGYVRGTLMGDIERARAYEKQRVRLTPEQMAEAIEKAIHPRDRIAVAVGCNTGLRVSSLVQLRIGDIDLTAGKIKYVNVKLKRERFIPITADLDRELRRWFAWYEGYCGPLQDDWFLVPARPRGGGQDGIEVIPTQAAAKVLRVAHRVLKELGVDQKGEGFHTFRRSVGRAVYEQALSENNPRAVHVAQALLDHSSVVVTQRYLGTDFDQEALHEQLRGKSFLARDEVSDDNVVVKVDFGRRSRGA
jgi:integrase